MVVKINEHISFGDGNFHVIAGPCAVEDYEMMEQILIFLRRFDIRMIRGGLFKPRTNPESFQGLGLEGVEIIRDLKRRFDFCFVTELIDMKHVDEMMDIVDVVQIGSRNMQNFSLLQDVGRLGKPILLKRGMSATLYEWMMAAEYILKTGNDRIIFCERGIRTFENYTRNTLDIMAIPILQKETHLPVIADPSHAVGRSDYILKASKAVQAIGADGLMLEVHPKPSLALSDGHQSIDPEEFSELMELLGGCAC